MGGRSGVDYPGLDPILAEIVNLAGEDWLRGYRTKRLPLIPVPKPRQAPKDRYDPSPSVVRYREFVNNVAAVTARYRSQIPKAGLHMIFFVPMPRSWSKKKRTRMEGTPKETRPDTTNYIKALEDALWKEDSAVWDIRGTKIWAEEGAIVLRWKVKDD